MEQFKDRVLASTLGLVFMHQKAQSDVLEVLDVVLLVKQGLCWRYGKK